MFNTITVNEITLKHEWSWLNKMMMAMLEQVAET